MENANRELYVNVNVVEKYTSKRTPDEQADLVGSAEHALHARHLVHEDAGRREAQPVLVAVLPLHTHRAQSRTNNNNQLLFVFSTNTSSRELICASAARVNLKCK